MAKTFWTMQIQPGGNKVSSKDLKKFFLRKNLVGIDANEYKNLFVNDLQIGDILIVRNDERPLALCHVSGESQRNNDEETEAFWQNNRGGHDNLIVREIEVLAYGDEALKQEFKDSTGEKTWGGKGLSAQNALSRCKKWTFAKWWYKKVMKLQEEEKSVELQNELTALLEANHNLILSGAPGTGKTYLARKIAKDMEAEMAFVQFHQSYDYSDFVEGLRPVTLENGQTGFKLQDGIFKKFCKKAAKEAAAAKDKAKKYVFVIDEINRAEPSRVLGELFFAIDPGYRGVKGKVKTQYANLSKEIMEGCEEPGEFYVPENVYIIGTMNDIDRSVDSIDFALRRRFVWREIGYEDTMDSILEKFPEVFEDGEEKSKIREMAKANIKAINDYIDEHLKELGAAYHIGAAYYLKLNKYIKDDTPLTGKDPWKKFWYLHLKPLLAEYLRGRDDKEDRLQGLLKAYETSLGFPIEE